MIWENFQNFIGHEGVQAGIVVMSALLVTWARQKMNSASKSIKASVFNWKSTDTNAKRVLELVQIVSSLVRENKDIEQRIDTRTICLERKIEMLADMLKEITLGSSIKDSNKIGFAKHYDAFRTLFATTETPAHKKETVIEEIVQAETKEKEEKIKKVDNYIENAKRLAMKGEDDGTKPA